MFTVARFVGVSNPRCYMLLVHKFASLFHICFLGVQTGAVVPNFQGIPMPNNFMGPNMASGNAMGYPLMPFYQYSPYGYATSAMPYYPSPFIPQYVRACLC